MKRMKNSDENKSENIAWRQLMNRNYCALVLKSEGHEEAKRILEEGYQRDLLAISEVRKNIKI